MLDTYMIYIVLGVFGLALGSFVNALVWREYLSEQNGTKKGKVKSKKSSDTSIVTGRSMCPDCGHELSARDLMPVVSWVLLKGKCRYCKKPISAQYPIVEALTSILFITAYSFWPFALNSLAAYFLLSTFYLVLSLGMALALYDLKWMILPTRLIYIFTGLSAVFLTFLAISYSDWSLAVSGVIGALLFSGFFYILYQISGGKWIGGGDVRLAVGLGLLLGWQKSVVCLTIAAYLGTIVILALFAIGKYHKKMKLPFGPFLLAGTYLTVLWGQSIIDWYKRLSGL